LASASSTRASQNWLLPPAVGAAGGGQVLTGPSRMLAEGANGENRGGVVG